MPFVGLFVSRSRVACVIWSVIVTIEAFWIGQGLSSFGAGMAAWNRYGEPPPSWMLGAIFAGLAVPVTLFLKACINANKTEQRQTKCTRSYELLQSYSFNCPHCHQPISTLTEMIGMEATCSKCNNPLVVPPPDA